MGRNYQEDEKYHKQEWMDDAQWECACMLADLRGGFHHVNETIRRCGKGIEVNLRVNFATYDGNLLTRLVFMAHDRSIRADLGPSGPGMVKLTLHKRPKRIRSNNPLRESWERHPRIEEALADYRECYGSKVYEEADAA